ncbi:uncharacterized protein BX663DRAFT_533335 [Cokeromyces recurvatus]|uniref:uncharacterized protein n=1 Tax=Cokeromyces recurvatus TaxID=90255 RepID=UPI0022208CD2|nr:uncharacterized protein BX663DRAFT_533335 [Cokeromyces recurvatus]KAI7898467.1 hypothetical protein BX663DRAFT_533335 [Cokeromyces recurvatus]
MDQYQKQILCAQQEITKLKGDKIDKRNLLEQTLEYFNQQQTRIDDLESVLTSVREWIEDRLAGLEKVIDEKKAQIERLFDDMKTTAYQLRATFHHDGKSGTGHYWAYIWVETSLSEGRWFKFCDAIVTPATEQDILNDPIPPFSFIYVSDALPKVTKEQLYDCIPDTLKEFIQVDNESFTKEIYAHDHPMEDTMLISTTNTTTTSDDDVGFIEKTSSDSVHFMDSSILLDDSSVGTAVNQGQTEEAHHYSFSGSRLKNRVNSKIVEVSSYSSDDDRFLKSFENFLARAQNQLSLEHLYLFYSTEKEGDAVVINEEASEQDEELKSIWKEYRAYLKIGEMVVKSLSYFVNQDYSRALQGFLDSKRAEASWKTQIMLDTEVCNDYTGLDTLSFYPIILKYGKKCLEILNENAFKKALHASYRTRGLEEGIRIAYQAHSIIRPDNITQDPFYQSLGQLWLSFTEQWSELTESQGDLLNTLIMIYLEGQISGIHTGSRSSSPIPNQDSDDDDDNGFMLWQKYKQLCIESDMLLDSLSNK